MKVILLKDVPKIGKKNEIKDVSDGFAQNALLPKRLAQIATPAAIQALKESQERVARAQTQEVDSMKLAIEQLQNQKLVVELAANGQGHLFSKFKIEQLKKVFKEKNISFDPKYTVPFEFKEVGVYTIKIKSPQLSGDFTLEIKGI
jgi:large subunit ribosomal protein L9